MSTDTQTIIDAYYAALKAGDKTALSKMLSADMRVDYYGPDGLFPWQGEWIGIARYFEFLDTVAANLTIDKVTPRQRIFSDSGAVIVLDGEWTVLATKARVCATVANIFTIEDGKITRYQVFTDTAAFGIGVGALEA